MMFECNRNSPSICICSHTCLQANFRLILVGRAPRRPICQNPLWVFNCLTLVTLCVAFPAVAKKSGRLNGLISLKLTIPRLAQLIRLSSLYDINACPHEFLLLKEIKGLTQSQLNQSFQGLRGMLSHAAI